MEDMDVEGLGVKEVSGGSQKLRSLPPSGKCSRAGNKGKKTG
jgi:hypothetical protein